jgi:hypothetical protein
LPAIPMAKNSHRYQLRKCSQSGTPWWLRMNADAGSARVLAHREINSRKADRLPQEAGLRLRKPPTAPRALPVSAFIRNHHGVPDWENFLS